MSKIFKVMKGEPVELEHLRYPLWVTPKINGVRGYVRNGVVLSTSNKPLPNVNLQKFFGACEHLDGEFVVGDILDSQNSLNKTTSIVMADDKPIDGLRFYAFDYVKHPELPYAQRTQQLISDAPEYLRVTKLSNAIVKDEATLLQLEHRFVEMGYEGLITRDPAAAYKFGKSTAKQAWMGKMKRFKDDEAVIVGYTERMHNTNEKVISETGRSKRSSAKAGKVGLGTIGSLVCRTKAGHEFGIGTGLNEATAAYLWSIRDKDLVGRFVKYKYFEIGSGDVPVLPVYLDLRDPRDM
jgi:DNA ligase-1